MRTYATYYNQMSQAFEPFIEPWSLEVIIKQKSKDHLQDIKIFSKDFLNINITYGMAFNITEVKARGLDKMDKIQKKIRLEVEHPGSKEEVEAAQAK